MWLWLAFILFVFFLVALDLGVFHRETRTIAFKEALILSAGWITVARWVSSNMFRTCMPGVIGLLSWLLPAPGAGPRSARWRRRRCPGSWRPPPGRP